MLDISKLENAKTAQDKTIARCPACAAMGKDGTGNHLAVYKNGNFGCVIDNSVEHRNVILKLVGLDPNSVETDFVQEYKQPIPQVERVFPDSILIGLVKDHSFYTSKGIRDAVLEELKAGIAFKGNMNGRYVFPIYDRKGRIHGFSGRALYGQEIKWKHMGLKTNWVYPAHFNHDDIKNAKSVILVESIGDAVNLMSAGVRNVLVLFGVTLHSKLLSYLIANNPNQIYISTNNDIKHNVGQDAAERIARKLLNYFGPEKIKIRLPTKKDFGDMTEEEIKLFWKDYDKQN